MDIKNESQQDPVDVDPNKVAESIDTPQDESRDEAQGPNVGMTDGQKPSNTIVQEERIEEGVEELKSQIKALNDRYIRLIAEFDNFKRRTHREYERMAASAGEKLLRDMIPLRDNFERGLKTKDSSADFAMLYEGMRLIFTRFDEVLSANGLVPYGEPGEEFDPNVHDAMMKIPNETVPDGHIAEVFERGYKLNGIIIRHAKVIVSSGKPEGVEQPDESARKERA